MRACALLFALLRAVHSRTVISLGASLPLVNSTACAPAWARWYLATEAVSAVTSSAWWPAHLSLALEFESSPEASHVDALLREAAFAGITSAPPQCALAGDTCAVVRAGMFSIGSAASVEVAQVARAAPIPFVAVGARAMGLIDDESTASPVFRLGANADDVAGAMWAFIRLMGWQVAHVLFMSADADSADVAAALLARSTGGSDHAHAAAEGSDAFRIMHTWPLKTPHSILDALGEILTGEPRIVILLAPAADAVTVLSKAQEMGMWGKGWTWVGDAWVGDLVTGGGAAAAMSAERRALLPHLGGSVGIAPAPPSVHSSALAARLARVRFSDIMNATRRAALSTVLSTLGSPVGVGGLYPLSPPSPSSATCALLYATPFASVGFPLDATGSDSFDAIWHLASAAAACSSTPTVAPTIACIIAALGKQSRASPLTGRSPKFSAHGDEEGAPLALHNARVDGSLAIVGAWHGSLATHGDGEWVLSDKVQWSSGSTVIPSDRVSQFDEVLALAFFIVLIGLVISALTETVIHRSGFAETMPESLITIFVGLGIGAIVRVTSSEEIRAAAAFSNDIFMLGLLPIIIAESGYALDKAVFFKNLWSIVAFAVAGTVISALTIGAFVYAAGQSGVVFALSFEECMAFASLLSATDPVATLAVFGALRVDPTLNALVYGESVLNDAVGIVLYRVFTSFIVENVTGNSLGLAIFRFVQILAVSIIMGYVVGFVCTAVFRIMFTESAHTAVNSPRASQAFGSSSPAASPSRELASPPVKGRGVFTYFVSSAVKIIRLGGEASYAHGEEKAYEGIGESVLLLVFLYMSFALTEALRFSGIVAALFCGIALSQYTRKIMSPAGKRMATAVLRLLASLADTIVFLQIGMTIALSITLDDAGVGVLFIVTLLGCLVGRALNIAPLSALLNIFRKQKIGLPAQAQMWWAGLRGAIAFASATSFPSQHRATLLNVTSWICLVTICVMGPTTPTVLRKLKIPYNISQSADPGVDDDEPLEDESFVHTCNWAETALRTADTFIRRVIYGKDLHDAILMKDSAKRERRLRVLKLPASVNGEVGVESPRDTFSTPPRPLPSAQKDNAPAPIEHTPIIGLRSATASRKGSALDDAQAHAAAPTTLDITVPNEVTEESSQ